jgi:hypothetical protein
MEPVEYRHVVLGLIFLKRISNAFQERHGTLKVEQCTKPEDCADYIVTNALWVSFGSTSTHPIGSRKVQIPALNRPTCFLKIGQREAAEGGRDEPMEV